MVRTRYLNRCGAGRRNASSARLILQGEHDFARWVLTNKRYTASILGAPAVRVVLDLRDPAHDPQRGSDHTSLPARAPRRVKKVRESVETRIVYRGPDNTDTCPGGLRLNEQEAWDKYYAPFMTPDMDPHKEDIMKDAFRLWWSYCPQSHRKYDHTSGKLLSFEEMFRMYRSSCASIAELREYYATKMTALENLSEVVLQTVIEKEGVKVYHANPNLLQREDRKYYEEFRSVPYLMAVLADEDTVARTPREDSG